jgi:hypothetical protein
LIVDQAEAHILSSLGWVDHGALWRCETASGRTPDVPLSEAPYLTLHAGADDLVAVVHHFDRRPVELTAHTLTAVDRRLARIILAEGEPVFEGGHVGLGAPSPRPHRLLSLAGRVVRRRLVPG